jgi:hypothetical protein
MHPISTGAEAQEIFCVEEITLVTQSKMEFDVRV